MDMTLARASFSSSDDSSINASTRPTTPEWSPYMQPQRLEHHLDARLQSLQQSDEVDLNFGLETAALPIDRVTPNSPIQNICIIGAGYVGGPTAAVIALHNPTVRVTVLDRDPTRIDSWKSKHLPIHEPGLDLVVRIARDGGLRQEHPDDAALPTAQNLPLTDRQRRRGNLFFSTDSAASIGSADLVFLAVNTPTKRSGRGAGAASDLSAFESAARDIAKFAKNGTIVVEKSTVPCGTAKLISAILFSVRPDETFPILSNPEFLAEGSAIKNLLHPDRVLIGSIPSIAGRLAAKQLGALYAAWVPKNRILYTNVWSSELSKLVANAMLAQRISSMNSISALCEKTGADIREITRAIGTDDRIGSRFLQAGLGFGGSCFRKDISSLVYISESLGLPEVADYWRSVLSINMFQRQRFTDKIVSRLNNTLSGKKVTLLGFAYKKDTGDTRESLAVDIIASLLRECPKEIAIFDPCCAEDGILKETAHLSKAEEIVRVYTNPYEACDGASSVAIITEWDFLKSSCSSPMRSALKATKIIAQEVPDLAEEPLRSYVPLALELCPVECSLCSSSQNQASFQADQRLDWARVAKGMKYPKYVVDGRSVLDDRAMKAIGIDVDGLGWGALGP